MAAFYIIFQTTSSVKGIILLLPFLCNIKIHNKCKAGIQTSLGGFEPAWKTSSFIEEGKPNVSKRNFRLFQTERVCRRQFQI